MSIKIEDLKIDPRFERLTPMREMQREALEDAILSAGEVYDPLIIWKGKNTVVDGHERLTIIKKHPHIKYELKEVDFEDWQHVMATIVSSHITRTDFNTYQKLEMAQECSDYWMAKEQARKNRGKRNDLNTVTEQKSVKVDTTLLLAKKAGVGRTTASNFLKVHKKASDVVKQKCRDEEMSIEDAYELIKSSQPNLRKSASTSKQCKPSSNPKSTGSAAAPKVQKGNKAVAAAENEGVQATDKSTQTKDIPANAFWITLNRNNKTIGVSRQAPGSTPENFKLNTITYPCEFKDIRNGGEVVEVRPKSGQAGHHDFMADIRNAS